MSRAQTQVKNGGSSGNETHNKAKHIARKKRGLDLAVARSVLAALGLHSKGGHMIYRSGKVVVIFCAIILFAACASNVQQKSVSGQGTVADERLQGDVMQMISTYESAAGGSNSPRLISTESLGKEGETYIERWVVESNGISIPYSVKLTPSSRGGVDYAIVRTP